MIFALIYTLFNQNRLLLTFDYIIFAIFYDFSVKHNFIVALHIYSMRKVENLTPYG